MISDREYRLRQRIDVLRDALDVALAENARLRARCRRLSRRVYELTRSREMWRARWLETGIHGRWRKR